VASSSSLGDDGKNAFDIAKHVTVPEANHAKSFGFEKRRPLCIVRTLRMLSTVQLNDQMALTTHEIANERPYRHLTREFKALELATA
jgi:hypothetical protein